MLRWAFFSRLYSVGSRSAGGKKGGAAASAPQKQQFRKKQKDALARAASATTSVTHKESLTDALFPKATEEGSQAAKVLSSEALSDRAAISKAWSRLTMMQMHAESAWEDQFLKSKLAAQHELQRVSPELAQAARQLDYSLPPVHRRIPTETPPEKFPFSVMISDGLNTINS